MKKLLSLALTVVLLACLAAPALATEEKVTFTWLHHFQEEGMQGWVNEIIKNFTEKHPNVTIDVEIVGADRYNQLLQTKIASDDAPMIFDLSGRTTLADFASAGHLADLTGDPCLPGITPYLLEHGALDGKQYGVPLDACGYGPHYDKDLFDRLGIEVPTTLTEMYAACEKIAAEGITPFASAFAEQWCLQIAVDVFLYPLCVKDNPNWYTDKMSLLSTFAGDENFKKAAELFYSFKPYWGDDPVGTTWDDAQNMLANGDAAMLVNGSWTIDGVAYKNPERNVRVFGFPYTDNAEDTLMVINPGSTLCLYNSQDAKKLEVAREFFNYVFSKESGDYYATLAMRITSVDGVDFSFSAPLTDILSYEKTFSTAGMNLFSSEYNKILYEEMTNFAMGDTGDVDALCATLDAAFASVQ